MHRKAAKMDDLLYTSSNRAAFIEELQQYFDIFTLLSTQYDEWSKLLGVSDQTWSSVA